MEFPAAPTVGLDLSSLNRDVVTGWERMASTLAAHTAAVPLAPTHAAQGRFGNLAVQLAWHLRGLRRAATRAGVDVVHAPTYPPPTLDAAATWTVFDDLVVGGHPEWARSGAVVWSRLGRRALRHVDRIVTHTATIADDLVAAGADPARIEVIAPYCPPLPAPSGVPAVVDAHGASVAFPERFVLAVGTLEARKQPALAASVARRLGFPIVFVGRHAAAPTALGVDDPNAVFAPVADDEQLSWCYRNTSLLIAASAYEGIDLPVLEAASVGTPVLASDIGVHHELADAAPFVVVADLERTVAVADALIDTRWDPVAIGTDAAGYAAAHEAIWADVAAARARR